MRVFQNQNHTIQPPIGVLALHQKKDSHAMGLVWDYAAGLDASANRVHPRLDIGEGIDNTHPALLIHVVCFGGGGRKITPFGIIYLGYFTRRTKITSFGSSSYLKQRALEEKYTNPWIMAIESIELSLNDMNQVRLLPFNCTALHHRLTSIYYTPLSKSQDLKPKQKVAALGLSLTWIYLTANIPRGVYMEEK
ncbi:hypothetical protein BDQ17DRAFT_1329618 [Cyathus striatus]|nr:hypothetical protein BDQ17DRAFT_1329618 [Cyathus striatus]